MKSKKIDQTTICKLVYETLDKLPKRYVVVMNMRRSRCQANVNIGGTKFELEVRIFDGGVDNWVHAPGVVNFTFEDSDGIEWWKEEYAALLQTVQKLCE